MPRRSHRLSLRRLARWTLGIRTHNQHRGLHGGLFASHSAAREEIKRGCEGWNRRTAPKRSFRSDWTRHQEQLLGVRLEAAFEVVESGGLEGRTLEKFPRCLAGFGGEAAVWPAKGSVAAAASIWCNVNPARKGEKSKAYSTGYLYLFVPHAVLFRATR